MELDTSTLLINPRMNFKVYLPLSEGFHSRDALHGSQGDLHDVLAAEGCLRKAAGSAERGNCHFLKLLNN